MPVAYGIWVYSAVVAWCFAMDVCRSVSLMRFDATGRVTSQALVNLHGGHLHRSQDASSRLLRTFIGNLQYIRWASLSALSAKSGETTKALPFNANVTNRRPTAHSKY